nr:hypothetical protein [Tanacetum cinerariifolium]
MLAINTLQGHLVIVVIVGLSFVCSYCPLTYNSWHKVHNKDRMWEYVLEKYIVPGEAKSHVLQSNGVLWRGNKSRLKKKHFYDLKDNKTRLKQRPKCIPENEFLQLLRLWNSKQDHVIWKVVKDMKLALILMQQKKSRLQQYEKANERNRQFVNTSATKKNQSRVKVTMGELLLNTKGSQMQRGLLTKNATKPNSATTSISCGSNRRLIDEDNEDEDDLRYQ